jgi:GDP-mannose 6-dehydrogenase
VPNADAVLDFAETIVVGNNDPEFKGLVGRVGEGQKVVDFVRITGKESLNGKYDGICW